MSEAERFFDNYGRDCIVLENGNSIRVDDLYQAFKARMLAELADDSEVVMVPINVSVT